MSPKGYSRSFPGILEDKEVTSSKERLMLHLRADSNSLNHKIKFRK